MSLHDHRAPPRDDSDWYDLIARLWYLGLLVVCAAAITIGLWPSLLTFGAILAVPTGLLAIIGLVRPAFFHSRPKLLWVVRSGMYAICFELLAFGIWMQWNQRRPVSLVVHQPAPARVRIVYDVANGEPVHRLSWGRVFDVPASGVVYTRYSMDLGFYSPANPHPLVVRLVRGAGDTVMYSGAWLQGGFARGLDCHYSHDEFIIGPDTMVHGPDTSRWPDRPASWLDSTGTWGVHCEHGVLQVDHAAPNHPSPRPTQACFYRRDGGLECSG